MSSNYSRFIPGEEIDAVAQWRFGAVDAAALLLEEQARTRLQDEQAEAFRQEGYAKGFAEGLAQGHGQAMLEAQEQVNAFLNNQGQDTARQLAALVASAHAQLDAAEQVAARGMLELACELARQVLRHEISTNPNALLPVIREALTPLIADSKSTVLKLHPLDMDMLEDVLRAEYPSLPLTLLADATITRGGCQIQSTGTQIDGTLEKRWSRAVGQLGLNLPWEAAADEQ
ncbi:FliH/SctL family protein [Curvibacter delicatus]|jgi:flagellar assembly protein FliH|uniref:FliH/SctL family protein n=1 Tax=Curvibacter delicatus TaxID=80879 RepID=UPI000835BBDB|nr:FliH/SctL family protein [Curvibacter delicatus]